MQQAIYKTPKSRKPKRKRMSKGSKALLIIVCVIVGIALILGGTVLVLSHIGRSQLTGSGDAMTAVDDAELLDAGRVRYKGQLYEYKDDITTILFMGVDSKQKNVTEGDFGEPNQSDVNVLAVLDPESKRITLISISRDAMCEIDVLDNEGNHVGTARMQLALAYAYGDGGDVSCQLTSGAVSRLFYDLPISAYASIYMNGVARLTDLVGGVTVTPAESFGQFVAGQTVTLTSANAEQYLRYREKTTEGNNTRMERQKAVLVQLVRAMLKQVRQNPTSVLTIYDGVQQNVTTDVNAPAMVYLARIAAGMEFNGDVRKVAGESVLGAENHAEFNVDETALYEMILDIFYKPVAG